MELSARGKNGQLYVDDIWVIITRQGFGAKVSQGFGKGEKKIPIQHIIAVQYKETNLMSSGYIQFTISGGNELSGGVRSALEDENSVVFGFKSEKFLAIKDFIETKIADKINGSNQNTMSSNSIADELKKLSELHQSGILTDDEFNQEKKRLLGS